jgi:hypothetical protein
MSAEPLIESPDRWGGLTASELGECLLKGGTTRHRADAAVLLPGPQMPSACPVRLSGRQDWTCVSTGCHVETSPTQVRVLSRQTPLVL